MRVLIADDSALIRDGLAHLLPVHGFEVAGAVSDLPALLAAVPATRPDVTTGASLPSSPTSARPVRACLASRTSKVSIRPREPVTNRSLPHGRSGLSSLLLVAPGDA
jgi:hypothetical protein